MESLALQNCTEIPPFSPFYFPPCGSPWNLGECASALDSEEQGHMRYFVGQIAESTADTLKACYEELWACHEEQGREAPAERRKAAR